MQLNAHDNMIETHLTKDEFHFILHNIGADEEFNRDGMTQKIAEAVGSFCSKLAIQAYRKEGKEELVEFLLNPQFPVDVEMYGVPDGSVFIRFRAMPVFDTSSSDGSSCLNDLVDFLREMTQHVLGDDYDDEDDEFFDDLDEDAANECLTCFWDNAIDEMINNFRRDYPKMTANDVIAKIVTSHCYQTILGMMDADSQAQFCQKVIAYVEKKFETPTEFVYRVENLDIALRAMKFVKRGAIIKRKGKYYVLTYDNYYVLNEYGHYVDNIFYYDKDEDVLCLIENGNFAKKGAE